VEAAVPEGAAAKNDIAEFTMRLFDLKINFKM
jgi:hypothetical protein